MLSQCRCPYITEYYGSYLHQTKLWIIMEYMAGGSVADLVGYFCRVASTFLIFKSESCLISRILYHLPYFLHKKQGP